MNTDSFRYQHPRLTLLLQWAALFAMLAGSIWAAMHNNQAPQLVMLALLYIISVNFSLPLAQSSVGLVPLVAISSLLIIEEPQTTIALFIVSYILAELIRPLWHSLWDITGLEQPDWKQQLGIGVVYLFPLNIAMWAHVQTGGTLPFIASGDDVFNAFLVLGISYGSAYFALCLLWWAAQKRPFAKFWQRNALPVLATGLISQPFALLGGIVYWSSGLPAFVIFSIAITIFSGLIWLAWQRNYILEKQLTQFAALNQSGISLRETLDLATVLQRTYEQVVQLVQVDAFALALREESGEWQINEYHAENGAENGILLDDFTRWVADNDRILDLNKHNLRFFARQHRLRLPAPAPNAWMGIPLASNEKIIGVMVLQRFTPNPSFTPWGRQVLLAVAGQASGAIQNARLYGLTDDALARRLEQLQALLNGMNEGVLMVDTHGRIALINPVAAALLGQSAKTLQNRAMRPSMSAFLGYKRDALNRQLMRLRDGDQIPKAQTLYQTADRAFIQRSDAPITAVNGQSMGWLMLFRDVTEEQALVEKRTDLTRMIVHDLRNPITTLNSAITLIEGQLRGDPDDLTPVYEWLDNAQRGVLDMLDMVDSLMDINRMEAGQMIVEAEAMRLPPLVQRVTNRVRPLAIQKEIEIIFNPPTNLPAVWADEEILRRVFINLLDNALKFTPANGRITITLTTEPINGKEDGVRCQICDTGPGIPSGAQDMVFDRFMRTNTGGAQVRGTGLGLTFCKLTIEAHNGRIWVEDAPGGGSCFAFTLPGIPNFEEEKNNA